MTPAISDILALAGHLLIIILLGVTWRWHIEDRNEIVRLSVENQKQKDMIAVLEKQVATKASEV